MEILRELLDLSALDVIDIVLVALLLYYIYKLIKGTVAINIFIGIIQNPESGIRPGLAWCI